MENKNIHPDHISISSIVKDIDQNKLLLPEFQRPFVWNIEQSKELFDSLIRGIFIGTFVLAKPKFDLSCRKIDSRPRTGKGSRAKFASDFYTEKHFEANQIFVALDGQQRITSIYRVLNGFDKIFFVLKDKDSIPLPNENIENIEQIVDGLSTTKVEGNLCIPLNEIYQCRDSYEDEVRDSIFNPATVSNNEIISHPELSERYFKILIKLRRLFVKLIESENQLSVFFLNMDIEKFCLFFERSNSKGTALSFIDIITAKIYKDFNLDKSIKQFKETHKTCVFDSGIIESFVRYISFVKTRKVDKKSILTNVVGNDFIENWNEISSLYVKTIKYLSSQKIIFSQKSFPYKTMFIPLIHFLQNIEHKDFSQLTNKQSEQIKFWLWGSLLNTRYGGGMMGSTNDIIVQDCEMLEKIAKNKPFDRDYLRPFKFDITYEDLLYTSSNGAVFTGLMYIVNYMNSFKNPFNSDAVDFESETNIHHIFPKAYLEANFQEESFENENVNSLLNKMIIGKLPNQKFSKDSPSMYLSKINKTTDIVTSLKTHLIPNPEKLANGYYDTRFEEFLMERSQLFTNIINQNLNNLKNSLLDSLQA